MIWSPSTSLPSWSTARQRSASPSWAMPRSRAVLHNGFLERAKVRGADAVVDVVAVRVGADDHDVRAGVLEDLRRAAAGGAVGAVQHHLDALQAVRQRAQQVDDVAVLGVGEALDAAHVAADGAHGLLAHLGLDGVFDVVRELLAAAGEELDAVVRRRVVGRGDHHAEVGVQVGHQVGRGRRGQDAGVVDVDAGAGEPRLDGCGDELAAGARVTGHHGARPAAVGVAVVAEHDGGRLGQLHRQLRRQQAVSQAPDTICSK